MTDYGVVEENFDVNSKFLELLERYILELCDAH